MKRIIKSSFLAFALTTLSFGAPVAPSFLDKIELPRETSWPDAPSKNLPATTPTLPSQAYVSDDNYPIVATGALQGRSGGAMFPGGMLFMVLGNFSQATNNSDSSTMHKNVLTWIYVLGLGNRWDIQITTPTLFNVRENSQTTTNNFVVPADTTLTFHKQNWAGKVGAHAFAVATNYIISLPTTTTAQASNPYGAGFGLGANWRYKSFGADFDIQGVFYGQKTDITPNAPHFNSKGRIAYALSHYFTMGVEYIADYSYRDPSYSAPQQPQLGTMVYVGPSVSIKIPQWKNSTFAIAPTWSVYDNQKVSSAKEPFRLTSRIMIFW